MLDNIMAAHEPPTEELKTAVLRTEDRKPAEELETGNRQPNYEQVTRHRRIACQGEDH